MSAVNEYVYVIEVVGTPGLVKIGYSKDPYSRLPVLQGAHPGQLSLREVVPCKSRGHALAVEGAAHLFFAKNRTQGEWFQLECARDAAVAIRYLTGMVRVAENSEVHELRGKGLSPRESEVVDLLGTGLRVSDIAVTLGRSVKTISTYTARATAKLGLRDVGALRVHAMQQRAQRTPSRLEINEGRR
jgi:DNA-binding CsgD family transcriptional regulator